MFSKYGFMEPPDIPEGRTALPHYLYMYVQVSPSLHRGAQRHKAARRMRHRLERPWH